MKRIHLFTRQNSIFFVIFGWYHEDFFQTVLPTLRHPFVDGQLDKKSLFYTE
ncbi:MAG: hypothetical protein U0264_02715 [Candidatus Kapaibacterium sp.]